ncbi:MAG: SLBB domain-containing protein [Candidatus Poribacteria bacterium]|nr:SLBB domain-containing protein [Candidatus Poribacteria bacterium]MDE0506558.1 SLBB domain-containing protein [Candidatus Poribacteria bacterium]
MTFSRLNLMLVFLILFVDATHGESYRIEPGDTLSIVVLDHPSYSRTIIVRQDGYSIYLGGELHLLGKSLQTAADLIGEQIKKYGRTENPIVIVDPLQGKGYLVWGAVTLPNRYSLAFHDKIGLYEALAKAGGLGGGADRENVKIIRADKSVETYDLSPNQDYREIDVYDGDIIFVSALGGVLVHGQVQKAGRFTIRERIRIDHALALADGPDVKADLASVTLFRANGESVDLNIANPSWKDNLDPDKEDIYYLKDGDLAFVPPLAISDIHGQVQVPEKRVQFHRRIRIDRALAQAGGPDIIADLSSVVIMRKNGEPVELKLDEEFWTNLDEQDDKYFLEDGDVMYIPSAYKVEPVHVLGYVRNPGPYRIREAITPREAVSRAGGFEDLAKRENLKIWRKDGTIEEIELNWEDDADSAGSKTLLFPGDSLEVGKRFHVNWSFVFSVLSLATTSVTSYILIRDRL